MTREQSNRGPDTPATYRIVVAGRLGQEWSFYFDGLEIDFGHLSDGSPATTLTGSVTDQAALHGILSRIRDVGLPLLEVVREDAAEHD